MIFPSYIGPALDENNLFFLIGSGIESLQKAAFVLLKFLYENFVPTLKYKTNEEEEIKQLMSD